MWEKTEKLNYWCAVAADVESVQYPKLTFCLSPQQVIRIYFTAAIFLIAQGHSLKTPEDNPNTKGNVDRASASNICVSWRLMVVSHCSNKVIAANGEILFCRVWFPWGKKKAVGGQRKWSEGLINDVFESGICLHSTLQLIGLPSSGTPCARGQ